MSQIIPLQMAIAFLAFWKPYGNVTLFFVSFSDIYGMWTGIMLHETNICSGGGEVLRSVKLKEG